MRGAIAMASSYCCFRKTKTRTPLPSFTIPQDQSIPLQDMLCLVLRPQGEVVVIEGIGGLGKTWAAKAAFETARNSNRFDNYMWVSLSRSCSLRRCIKKIAACLSIDIGEELLSSGIRVMIKEHLARRKFLLVLDNAYFVEENILWHLGIPCPREQSLGSKVIVTTRTRRALSVMDPALVITPQALLYQESYDLLREKIGKDIDLELIDNCYGMPLSIILLAGALCDVPTQEEFSKLISEAYVAQGPKVSVFTTMIRLVKFGYLRLPSDTARHCFLYCLLFPDDEAISVKDLIMFWKLDGMIQEASGESHEAKCNGKEIVHVLLKHGLDHSEGDDHIRMHDVIRETVSQLGRDNGYVEQPQRYFDGDIRFENLARLGGRISLMNTIKEELRASPSHECFSTSTLLLRGNRHMRTISEDFFCRVGMLRVLDLSFTPIRILPQSISCLYYLRLLLLVGCGHLEKIQHIGSLHMLEILDASGCGSLKSVESGSFDRMRLLKILDLSRTSIAYLPSLAACMELTQLLLQDCPCPGSEQTTETSHNSCDTESIKFAYGVSKTGAVSNLQIGTSKDLVNWMGMLWLPPGLTFEFSDRFGMRVSQDVNQDRKTRIYASHANFVESLDKDSPLWSNCLGKFHIVISPLSHDQTMGNGFGVRSTKFSAVDAGQSGDFDRVLEINCVSIPNDLEGILRHAELISLKSVTSSNLAWTLNTGRLAAARELWIDDCHQLESIFFLEEVATMVKLQSIWISNMDNLAYLCQEGTAENPTGFSCLTHLHLDCCPKLSFLFPSSLRLPNLRRLQIRFCDGLGRVLDEPAPAAEHALPGLQSLQLWELPELGCICGGVLPSLKDLKVKGCAKLKGIPIGVTENNPFFTTITGEMQWWVGRSGVG